MTHGVLGISATALGLAALSCFCAPQARAVTPDAAAPSLSEPAPTPGWAEAGPTAAGGETAIPPHRPYVAGGHAAARHSAWRSAHRTTHVGRNPLADAATGVVGGVADLGSVAAYPFYCFPNYGSCSVRVPYRY